MTGRSFLPGYEWPRSDRGSTGLWVLVVVAIAAMLALLVVPAAKAQEDGNTAERVRIPFPRDDGSLTPYTFELGYPLMTLVYDTLYWRGGGAWLARRLRKTNGGMRMEIRLRKAKWHDGRDVAPEDVEFTYEYFKTRYHPRFTPQLDPVIDAEVVDDATVAINLKHPTPGFGQVLADVPILPRHLWEGLGEGETPYGPPVGSGPYRLVRHRVGKSYRFRATPDYYLGEPRVRTIEVSFINDFERTVRAFRSRDIDMIPVTLPDATQRQLRGAAFETASGTLYTGTVLMFNTRRPPFDSGRARRAVSAALDLSRIARATVGGDPLSFQADRGYVHPASGFAAEGKLHRFDEARARAELEALDLPPIRILAPAGDPVRSEAGRQVALALERAGADAAREAVPFRELAAAVGQDDQSSPTFEAAIWSAPPQASYSPDYLSLIFGSESEALSPLNYSGYSNPEFNRLAGRARRETNPFERRGLVRSQLQLLAADAPVVPLFYPEGAFVYRPGIYEGWAYVTGTGILDKQSFLPSSIRERVPSRASPFDPSGSGSGIGVLGILALGMIGAVLLVIVFGIVERVRTG